MTLAFRPLSLQDKEAIDQRLQAAPPQISELTFTNLFMWRCYYQFFITEVEGFLTLLAQPIGSRPYFFPPLGRGDLQGWLEACLDYFRYLGVPPRFERFPESLVRGLSLPPGLRVLPDRDNADYVYRVQDLIRLSGNRYHTQKNHINRFSKRHVWTYEPLTPETVQACLGLQEEWCRVKQCLESHSLLHEDRAIVEAFTHFAALPFQGGVIRVAGKVEAFTLGEMLNPETVVIHIEKANPEIPGLYPLLQQQFLAHHWPHVPFVNREQDLGIDGLRKSKLSYHPVFLVEKFRLLAVDPVEGAA